jgi:diguanylate cyclase (GGDEF)-like protein
VAGIWWGGAALGAVAGAVTGAAALAWAWQRERAARAELARRVGALEGLLSEGAQRYKRTARGLATPVAVGEAGDPLVDLLQVICDATGAREATYWRIAADGVLAPFVSSAGGVVPAPDEAVRPLAQWAETEGIATVDDALADGTAVAVAPVPDRRQGGTRGALVLRANLPWVGDRAAFKRRIEGHGVVLSRVAALLDGQRTAAHQHQIVRALLSASQEFSTHRDAGRLAERVCEEAVLVSGGQRAAVVRWDASRAVGEVVAVSIGHTVQVGQEVSVLSAVGEGINEGRQVIWQRAAGDAPVFADGEPRWRIGALVSSLLPRGKAVLGALVVDADTPGAFPEQVTRNLGLLAAIAVSPLEALWDYAEVERRAKTDALTGLWNRRHFTAELTRWQDQADRYAKPVSLVMVDVDHFKRVNDTHGHAAGDDVLRHVASLLRDGARTVDTVARLGGEEFAVLLPNTEAPGAAEVAERLRALVASRPVRVANGTLLTVTASFGVAAYPAPTVQRDAFVAAADAALYAAKRDGRNRVVVSGA